VKILLSLLQQLSVRLYDKIFLYTFFHVLFICHQKCKIGLRDEDDKKVCKMKF